MIHSAGRSPINAYVTVPALRTTTVEVPLHSLFYPGCDLAPHIDAPLHSLSSVHLIRRHDEVRLEVSRSTPVLIFFSNFLYYLEHHPDVLLNQVHSTKDRIM